MIDAATREAVNAADGSYECVIERGFSKHLFCLTEDRIIGAGLTIVTLPLTEIRTAVEDQSNVVYVRWKAGCFWRVIASVYEQGV